MTYTTLRHFADSWGLVVMGLAYLVLCGWAFRPGARDRNGSAAKVIFKDSENG